MGVIEEEEIKQKKLEIREWTEEDEEKVTLIISYKKILGTRKLKRKVVS